MPSYEVKLPDNMVGMTLKGGHNVMYLEAADATDALEIAAGYHDGDMSWANAVATEITVASDLSPQTNSEGKTVAFNLEIVITGGTVNETFSYTAVATDEVDDLWAAMPALLNANDDIANAAWSTPNLTVADVADNIGDHTVTCVVKYGDTPLSSFVGAITDEGIAGAALVVAATAAPVIPVVRGTAKTL